MSTPPGAALSADAVQEVVNAAQRGRSAVVPHALPPDLLGDDAALERLAGRLPKGWILARDGEVPVVTGRRAPELGAVLPHQREVATVTRLYHVQRDPELRGLTDSVYDPLEAAWDESEPWLERDAGFFLTSHGGVTAAHADRHHNLLLQLAGSKTIGFAPPGSRDHADVVARSMPSLMVKRMPEPHQVIELHAGSALYLPPYSVHWVRSSDRSAALSCGWSSAATVRAGNVHAANARLQRLGVRPSPVGRGRDELTLRLVSAGQRLRAGTRSR